MSEKEVDDLRVVRRFAGFEGPRAVFHHIFRACLIEVRLFCERDTSVYYGRVRITFPTSTYPSKGNRVIRIIAGVHSRLILCMDAQGHEKEKEIL